MNCKGAGCDGLKARAFEKGSVAAAGAKRRPSPSAAPVGGPRGQDGGGNRQKRAERVCVSLSLLATLPRVNIRSFPTSGGPCVVFEGQRKPSQWGCTRNKRG